MPSPRSFLTAFIVWLGGLVVLFLVIDFLVMPWAAGKFRPTVEVPAVTGMDPALAEDRLRELGLRFAHERSADEHSILVPRGLVLTQTPAAGAQVKAGRRVWVGLSLGREPYVVPDGGS